VFSGIVFSEKIVLSYDRGEHLNIT